MDWFNIYGLGIVVVLLIPNILFAVKCKAGFENQYGTKGIRRLEQIGRFGCIGFMIFNIPGTWLGWWSDGAFAAYLVVNGVLAALYCVLWGILWKKNSVFRALVLSIIPSAAFLLSGVLCRSALLLLAAALFAPAHVIISYQNARIRV